MAPTFKPHVLAKSGTRLLYPTRLIILYWPRSLFGPNFQIADDQPPLNADLLPSDGAEHSEVQFHRMANVLALAGPNSRFSLPNSRAAGFLAGFWHGLIAPIALFVSLIQANRSDLRKQKSWTVVRFRIPARCHRSRKRSSLDPDNVGLGQQHLFHCPTMRPFPRGR